MASWWTAAEILDELEDNVVSRVIQAVGLFGDILSLEDTMEPILSVGGPERLQSKTEEKAEEEDESKKKSDEKKKGENEQEGLGEEVKKNGEVEGGEGRGDQVETEVRTDDHKVESGEEQEKSVAEGREDQTSDEIQGDLRVGCSQEQKQISQREIVEEDQAEVEKHCEVFCGTNGKDGEKDRVLEGERGEEEEGEMTEREQKSENKAESRAAKEEQLEEEGREEEGPGEVQVEDVGEEDKTNQEVSAITRDGGNVDGQEEAAEEKQCEVEGKDLKLKEENSQMTEEKEEISEENEAGAEEKTELDKEEEDKRQEDVENKEQSELPVKPGEETTSKEEHDRQQEVEVDKLMEREDETKQGLKLMEQSDEKEEEQQDESAEGTGSAGDDEKKDTGKAGKEDGTEEEIRPQKVEGANQRPEVKGNKRKKEEEEEEQVALSPAPETGRGSEVLEAVPAVEEGSQACGKHRQDVYPTSLGHYNVPIEEEGEEKLDDEEEGEEEQEDEKEEAPDLTKPAPLRDTDVDSAGASQEISQQVEAQQLEGRLQAPMTSLPAAGCGVTPEPLSGPDCRPEDGAGSMDGEPRPTQHAPGSGGPVGKPQEGDGVDAGQVTDQNSRNSSKTEDKKKTGGHQSSKYKSVSYRKIRKGNTRQRIDEFESMMNF